MAIPISGISRTGICVVASATLAPLALHLGTGQSRRKHEYKQRIDMIKPTKLIAVALPADSVRSSPCAQACGSKRKSKMRRQSTCKGYTSVGSQPIRISRGNQVIGKWSLTEVRERLENESLALTDSFYDEDTSDWLPLSELLIKRTAVEAVKPAIWPCYCGTGLPFKICCGDGRKF